jgi:hypothetical protein
VTAIGRPARRWARAFMGPTASDGSTAEPLLNPIGRGAPGSGSGVGGGGGATGGGVGAVTAGTARPGIVGTGGGLSGTAGNGAAALDASTGCGAAPADGAGCAVGDAGAACAWAGGTGAAAEGGADAATKLALDDSSSAGGATGRGAGWAGGGAGGESAVFITYCALARSAARPLAISVRTAGLPGAGRGGTVPSEGNGASAFGGGGRSSAIRPPSSECHQSTGSLEDCAPQAAKTGAVNTSATNPGPSLGPGRS